jgi:hypothetical protein
MGREDNIYLELMLILASLPIQVGLPDPNLAYDRTRANNEDDWAILDRQHHLGNEITVKPWRGTFVAVH